MGLDDLLIEIDAQRDYISDSGKEIWNVLEAREIDNVILTGVHTNMCVLGRPFGQQRIRKAFSHLQAVGINTRVVSPQEVKELEPHVSIEGIAAAAYEPESGYADPAATTTAYAQRAKELGALPPVDGALACRARRRSSTADAA